VIPLTLHTTSKNTAPATQKAVANEPLLESAREPAPLLQLKNGKQSAAPAAPSAPPSNGPSGPRKPSTIQALRQLAAQSPKRTTHTRMKALQRKPVAANENKDASKTQDPPAVAPTANTPAAPVKKPDTVYDLSKGFNIDQALKDYLATLKGTWVKIDVKMGQYASGVFSVRLNDQDKVEFEQNQAMEFDLFPFQSALKKGGLAPFLSFRYLHDANNAEAELAFRENGGALQTGAQSFVDKALNGQAEMGTAGLSKFEVSSVTTGFTDGDFFIHVGGLKVSVDGFIDAKGTFGFRKDDYYFDAAAEVNISDSVKGSIQLTKDSAGISGTGALNVDIEKVSGSIQGQFMHGSLIIEGEVGYKSEKFQGKVFVVVAEASVADRIMYTKMGLAPPKKDMLGAKSLSDLNQEGKPKPKKKEDMTVVGFGEVAIQFTDWLHAQGKVGMDSKGNITLLGEIGIPQPIELMEQKTKSKIFEQGFKSPIPGWSLGPLGGAFLFLKGSLELKGGFGPITLTEAKISGQYSTRPDIPTKLNITGGLNISAFGAIILGVDAGIGLEALGHEFKAGVYAKGMLSLQAYADALVNLGYEEQSVPGGAQGETTLEGDFQAAAKVAFELSGGVFVELDAPLWSPLSDMRKNWEFFKREWTLGEWAIGADLNWKVGSEEGPELKMKPAEFDGEKFYSDMSKEGSSKGADGGQKPGEKSTGKFSPKGSGGDTKDDPKMGEKKSGIDVDIKAEEKEGHQKGEKGKGEKGGNVPTPSAPFMISGENHELIILEGKKNSQLMIDNSPNELITILNKTRAAIVKKPKYQQKLGDNHKAAVKAIEGATKQATGLKDQANKKPIKAKQQKKLAQSLKKMAHTLDRFLNKYKEVELIGMKKVKKEKTQTTQKVGMWQGQAKTGGTRAKKDKLGAKSL
jgi:hypothetical protein